MMCDGWTSLVMSAATLALVWAGRREPAWYSARRSRRLFTAKEPIDLLRANEGVSDILGEEAPEGLIDFEMKTPDSSP